MAKMTQCDVIMLHLRDFGSIDSLIAFSEYGILRLASRINDLKRMGVNITSHTECKKNRYGQKVHYSVYELAKEN